MPYILIDCGALCYLSMDFLERVAKVFGFCGELAPSIHDQDKEQGPWHFIFLS
jgi:hypothetical protein